MWNSKQLDDLVEQLRQCIPTGVREIPKDIEKNFKAILQSALSKLDLVTREEFDAQVAVLERTRKKLETLEKEVKKLEKSHTTKHKKA
ncbi:MAG TPA: accessory factor UbiK family protein [Gammaproteobacteria bacterium]|nr:accessory factor UbiK family protein [Gammaproteobacteria bacterium]